MIVDTTPNNPSKAGWVVTVTIVEVRTVVSGMVVVIVTEEAPAAVEAACVVVVVESTTSVSVDATVVVVLVAAVIVVTISDARILRAPLVHVLECWYKHDLRWYHGSSC